MKDPIRISIVEDDDRIRNMFIILLEGAEGFRCVSAYPNAEDALADLPSKKPDIVLMDINLPGMNGIECVKKLKAEESDISVVMLTVYEDNERIFQSLQAGAVGYLLKSTSPSDILESLKDVNDGGAPMSAQIARKVVQSFHKPEKSSKKLASLTNREQEILSLLATGYMYKEIADELHVSMDTVKSHIRNIYDKLQVRSKTEAVVKYLNDK
ncbi:MAG: response regulator [Bacteroidota bacterium]